MTALHEQAIELAGMLAAPNLGDLPQVKRMLLTTQLKSLEGSLARALAKLDELGEKTRQRRERQCVGKPVIVGAVGQTIARCDECGSWAELASNGNWSTPHVNKGARQVPEPWNKEQTV